MFRKRKGKSSASTKKISSLHDEDPDETTATLQPSILAATRAEQAERTKRRAAAVIVGSADGNVSVKRRRVTETMLTQQQKQEQEQQSGGGGGGQNDGEEDEHMKEFIAQRMGKSSDGSSHEGGLSSSSSSSSSTSTETDTGKKSSEQELDPYGLLRRQNTHLTAEQGGASEQSGAGIAGIGIYEVDLPDVVKKRNAIETEKAIEAFKVENSYQSALAGLKLPNSFSGNFVASGHLLHRGDAVTMADGTKLKPKNAGAVRATDFKMMKHFKIKMRR